MTDVEYIWTQASWCLTAGRIAGTLMPWYLDSGQTLDTTHTLVHDRGWGGWGMTVGAFQFVLNKVTSYKVTQVYFLHCSYNIAPVFPVTKAY